MTLARRRYLAVRAGTYPAAVPPRSGADAAAAPARAAAAASDPWDEPLVSPTGPQAAVARPVAVPRPVVASSAAEPLLDECRADALSPSFALTGPQLPDPVPPSTGGAKPPLLMPDPRADEVPRARRRESPESLVPRRAAAGGSRRLVGGLAGALLGVVVAGLMLAFGGDGSGLQLDPGALWERAQEQRMQLMTGLLVFGFALIGVALAGGRGRSSSP